MIPGHQRVAQIHRAFSRAYDDELTVDQRKTIQGWANQMAQSEHAQVESSDDAVCIPDLYLNEPEHRGAGGEADVLMLDREHDRVAVKVYRPYQKDAAGRSVIAMALAAQHGIKNTPSVIASQDLKSKDSNGEEILVPVVIQEEAKGKNLDELEINDLDRIKDKSIEEFLLSLDKMISYGIEPDISEGNILFDTDTEQLNVNNKEFFKLNAQAGSSIIDIDHIDDFFEAKPLTERFEDEVLPLFEGLNEIIADKCKQVYQRLLAGGLLWQGPHQDHHDEHTDF